MIISGKVHVLGDNVDTDGMIPGRFLALSEPKEIATHIFEEIDPGFAQRVQPGDVIVAGRNFGCGSSREHAPWALADYGFRAVISTELADIFRSNCLKNGLLPVTVEEPTSAWLIAHAGAEVTLDLTAGTLTLPSGRAVKFPLEAFARHCLLQGVDELTFLLQRRNDIEAYERRA